MCARNLVTALKIIARIVKSLVIQPKITVGIAKNLVITIQYVQSQEQAVIVGSVGAVDITAMHVHLKKNTNFV